MFKGSPVHVSSLAGPATTGRYPASYPQRPTEGRSSCRGFPVAFRPPALASWTSCPAEGFRPSYDRPTGQKPGPRRGFHVPHIRYTTGLGALFTPRPPVFIASGPPDHRAPPLPGARSYHPGHHPIYPELRMTRRHQGFTRVHPPGLPQARQPLDGTATALGTALGLRTPPTRSRWRTPRRETDIEHKPVATRPTLSTS